MSGFSDYTTLLPRKEDGDGGGVGGGSLFCLRNTKPFFFLLLLVYITWEPMSLLRRRKLQGKMHAVNGHF